MTLHPRLDDPHAVLVACTPVSGSPEDADFREAAVRALRAADVQLSGERVVLKPNVTIGERFADPDSGITTHPQFVQGMAEYLLAHGAQARGITILEDPRNTDDEEPRHWRGTGYPEVAAATGAALHCPTRQTCVTKSVPRPHAFSELTVSAEATAPDTVLISVPKLKTHNLATTTLSMKNLMGAVHVRERHFCSQASREIPELVRREYSEFDPLLHAKWQDGLARRLVDMAQVITPRLNVVEGVVGRDGTGFRRGTNHVLGLTIVGINMVAVDTVTSYLMGFDPASITYLRMAGDAGLGPNSLADIKVFVAEDSGIAPCSDLEPLRTRPRFAVVSSLPGLAKVAQ